MKIKNFFKKVGRFFKRNAYYVILFLCISGIATMITLAAVNGGGGNKGDIIEQPVIDNSGGNDDIGSDNNEGGNDEIVDTQPVLFAMPVENHTAGMQFTGDGLIRQITLGDFRTHKAMDFKTEGNAEVMACFGGTVSEVYKNTREGNVIVLKHNDELFSIYKSLSDDIQVEVGYQVEKGDVIGYTSNTMGDEVMEGNHLHLEVKYQARLVDPMSFMEEGSK